MRSSNARRLGTHTSGGASVRDRGPTRTRWEICEAPRRCHGSRSSGRGPAGGSARPSPGTLPLVGHQPAATGALPVRRACPPVRPNPQHPARLGQVSGGDADTAKPNFASSHGRPLGVSRAVPILPLSTDDLSPQPHSLSVN